MMSITLDRWHAAQALERRYWAEGGPARRAEERLRRQFYAGLLGITRETVGGKSVLDLGAGPEGLALQKQELGLRAAVAVDPLRFSDQDEQRYADAGVARVFAAAEELTPGEYDEVWIYNLLQHVRDPVCVVRVAQASARERIRLFEWVATPVTEVHPHSTDAVELLGLFEGWHLSVLIGGLYRTPSWEQQFLALVAERGT